MADYEVKVRIKDDLSCEQRKFIEEKLNSITTELNMFIHEDGITYSKKQPYKKYEDIPAGVKFYFKLKKFEDYFALLEYYSYLEGDMNGEIRR